MVVFGLGKDFLFKSILGRCELQQTQAQFVVFKNLLYSKQPLGFARKWSVIYFDIAVGVDFRRPLGIFTAFISTFERCAQRLSPLVGLKQRLLQELWSVGQLYNYRPHFCSLFDAPGLVVSERVQ